MEILFYLIAGHALADFALQSDNMAKGKNRHTFVDPNSIPKGQKVMTVWPYWLTSHALIHGGLVGIITGIWWLGLAETAVHWAIDYTKCENWTGIHTDQGLHVACKVVWWLLA